MTVIFQNIAFHNVEELLPVEDGFRLCRVPAEVRRRLGPRAREASSFYGTGMELRFRILSGEVDLFLSPETEDTPLPVFLYYGSFQGGFQHTAYALRPGENRIHIAPSPHVELLRKVTREENLPFQPDVIRVVLPQYPLRFLRLKGNVEPPRPEDTPRRTYLAYGSSITQGSLALGMPHTYVFQIARRLGCDYLNLGFGDSALLEREMAEYLIARKDWAFASFELGVNMLNRFTNEEFEQRLIAFLDVLCADARPIFVTSLFGILKDNPQAPAFREIVRRHVRAPLIFTEGEALLHERAFISEDLVHPSLEGAAAIARRWGDIMERRLAAPETTEKGE